MSRKLDWADKEARKIANQLDVTNKTGVALIAAELRLAHNRGVGEGIERVDKAWTTYDGDPTRLKINLVKPEGTND